MTFDKCPIVEGVEKEWPTLGPKSRGTLGEQLIKSSLNLSQKTVELRALYCLVVGGECIRLKAEPVTNTNQRMHLIDCVKTAKRLQAASDIQSGIDLIVKYLLIRHTEAQMLFEWYKEHDYNEFCRLVAAVKLFLKDNKKARAVAVGRRFALLCKWMDTQEYVNALPAIMYIPQIGELRGEQR